MYLPTHFAEDDRALLLATMRRAPFALLISQGEGAPLVTPLPVLVGESGDGVMLRGHVSRANPHADRIGADGAESLILFQGPHALVDSGWYVNGPEVPTWNYVAIEARGPLHRLDGDDARQVARDLMATFTPDAPPIPPEYEARLLRGVVTFALPVAALAGKFKLSQNKRPEDREAATAHLLASEDPQARQVGALMRERE